MVFTRSGRLIGAASVGLVLVAGAVTAATPPVAAAATNISVPGATITRSDATAGTTLTVKATVARLDLWCSSGKLVVDKKATTIPCNRLLNVTTTGLTGNDTVAINATGFGSSLPKTTLTVKTGAGNDTVDVRHRGTLTVYAGAGNDTIGAGLATGTHPVNEQLLGEDGNDTLTNYGFVTAPRVIYGASPAEVAASRALRSTLRGGPGADRIVEDNLRWSDLTLDAADTVVHKEGPATYSPERTAGTAAAWTLDTASGDPYYPDTLTMGTATALDVRCAATTTADRYRINGLTVPETCAERPLNLSGTDRADTVTYDQKLGNGTGKYGMNLDVYLGAGDDTATIRHPLGAVVVHGGPGNDRISSGLYNSRSNAEATNTDQLQGEAGSDTLTNLGFLDPNPPTYVPAEPGAYDFRIGLDGGAGADRLVGATSTIDWFRADATDTMTDPGGPSLVELVATPGRDGVFVTGHEAAGTTVAVTGATTKTFTLSPLAIELRLDTLAGDDNLNLEGRSLRTAVFADTGDGIDALTIGFEPPLTDTWSPDGRIRTVTQTGYQPVSWVAANVERTTAANHD
jgi:hypothetical protein